MIQTQNMSEELSKLTAQVESLASRVEEDHGDIKAIKESVMRIELQLAEARGGAIAAKVFFGGVVTVAAGLVSFVVTHLFKKP